MTTHRDKKPAKAAPARKKRGALMVHERLRDAIQWLRIEPGTALDEVALAKEYEVSRTPIREALLLLANEGFVQFLQNRTTIVAPLSLHNQAAFLDTFILLSRGLVRAAALNGGADRKEFDTFVEAYGAKLEDGDLEAAFRAQLDLYRRVATLADNRFLEKYFVEAQDASVRIKLLYFFPHLDAAGRAKAIDHLAKVADAIVAGDAEGADAAVSRAILFELEVIQRGLGPRFGHRMSLDPGGPEAGDD
jgi:DNA-binding GntR family transcriptional regulator